jgi:hypothetical protein
VKFQSTSLRKVPAVPAGVLICGLMPPGGVCVLMWTSMPSGMKAIPWLSRTCSQKTPSSPRASPDCPQKDTSITATMLRHVSMPKPSVFRSGSEGNRLKVRGQRSQPPQHLCLATLPRLDPGHSRRVTTLLRMFMSSVALTSMSCGRKSEAGEGN